MSTARLHTKLHALPSGFLDESDLQEELRRATHADWTLLALVACAATATLLLAAAISLSY